MRKTILIAAMLFNPISLSAGEILSGDVGVIIKPVYFDTVNGVAHRMMPVQLAYATTGQRTDFAIIDLDQFGFPEQSSDLEIYLTDWVRDRILFADIRQTIVPDYHVLDLRTRTVYRPESNILNQVNGNMFLTPNCRYIVYFGSDYNLERETDQSYLQNPNILFTVVIDAETFNFVSRLDAFSARMGTFPPTYFFSDDTTVYIVNPFTGPKNRQLVRLGLPSLAIQDTIRFAPLCDSLCQEVIVEDVRANSALIHAFYSLGDSTGSAFKVIDLISKTAISRLDVPLSPVYGASRLSDDASFVAFQERQRYLIYDRLFRRSFELNGAPHFSLPFVKFGEGIMRFYSESERAILEYDLETGRFLRRR